MSIQKGEHLLLQYAYTRRVLREIRNKYGINKGQFEILCACYSLQTLRKPYFTIPQLLERLHGFQKNNMYNAFKEVTDLGYVKMTMKTSSIYVANYHSVTGEGEQVLRGYVKLISSLMEHGEF